MNKQEKPLVDKQFLLRKVSGKGGWTYALIPEISQEKKKFGWKKVRGFIDDFEIRQYNLMPTGNGQLFLPVRAEIRKKINKAEGDWVRIILYEDNMPVDIPEEFIVCLKDEPEALKKFELLSDNEKKKFVQWIYSSKSEDLKIERMATAISKIAKGEKPQ